MLCATLPFVTFHGRSLLTHLVVSWSRSSDALYGNTLASLPSSSRFLEEELARRYREAAPHVLAVLQDRFESASKELVKFETDLRAAEDVSSVRGTGGCRLLVCALVQRVDGSKRHPYKTSLYQPCKILISADLESRSSCPP